MTPAEAQLKALSVSMSYRDRAAFAMPEHAAQAQRKAIETALTWAEQDFFGADYEFKEIRILYYSDMPWQLFIWTTTGKKGDEGTLAASYGRTRRFFTFGKRGAIKAHDGNKWISGHKAAFVRYSI